MKLASRTRIVIALVTLGDAASAAALEAK